MEFSIGEVIQGFGLHNAGRFYTVLDAAPMRGNGEAQSRIKVEEHLTGKTFWTFTTWYRVAQ